MGGKERRSEGAKERSNDVMRSHHKNQGYSSPHLAPPAPPCPSSLLFHARFFITYPPPPRRFFPQLLQKFALEIKSIGSKREIFDSGKDVLESQKDMEMQSLEQFDAKLRDEYDQV